MRRIMRFQRLKLLALGGAAALVVLAAVLAFAAGSRAASGNICIKNSGTPPTKPASCVTEVVGPHFISVGGHAVSITKFHNEAGISGATATHVVLSLTLPSGVTTDGTPSAFVAAPGTTTFKPVSPNPCTGTTTISCSFGNIKGDGRAKIVVQIKGNAAGTYPLNVEATYGEGGGGTSNPPNDDQVNSDTLNVGAAGTAGDCTPIPPNQTNTVGTGTGNGQQTQVTAGPASDGTLPCTFIEAGVTAFAGGPGVTQNASFVEFPGLSGNGYATVDIIFNPVPTGFNLNKSPIFEDTSGNGSFSSFITVPACDKKGNIVGPTGNPAVGQTDPSPVNDSCIFARTSLGKGSGEIEMHVLANPFDQTYKG
jgi:hypothetical protein